MERIQSRAGIHGVLYEVVGIFTNSDGTTSTVTYGFDVDPIPAGPTISFGAGNLAAALSVTSKNLSKYLCKPEDKHRQRIFSRNGCNLYVLTEIASDGRIIVIGYDTETNNSINEYKVGELSIALDDVLSPRPTAEEVATLEDGSVTTPEGESIGPGF